MADELNRVFLWGLPRSMSTAFLKCMSNVDGVQIATQLYADAHYYGPDAKLPIGGPQDPMGSKMKELLETNYKKSQMSISGSDPSVMSLESIRGILEAPYPGKKVLFCKDQAQFLDGRYDMLPRGFKYSFLIRHPNRVLLSYRKYLLGYWGDFTDMRSLPPILSPPGCGYKELYDLFEHVRENIDPSPVILDADDLLQDPAGILSTYCSKMGVPYSDKLLSWEAGEDVLEQWIGTKICMVNTHAHAYKRVFASEGFGAPAPVPGLDSLPDDVQACAQFSMQYYEHLHHRRIVVNSDNK
ncbi:branched-chain-amino-acid aminotransferase-like protein 2 [Patiria miniata]|uniref:Sulfotransferase family protein n=1 Tax=Patiria miniata TaxID=46514 RepID=A0A914ATX0_PATMI|nr:branched-chain-amino-acid aminotransferase-like protein 2 [Patiria miniata]XP_038066935.1 branched-chain-amino-acid aminotransferase-like protein 2 [Patiria miniata]